MNGYNPNRLGATLATSAAIAGGVIAERLLNVLSTDPAYGSTDPAVVETVTPTPTPDVTFDSAPSSKAYGLPSPTPTPEPTPFTPVHKKGFKVKVPSLGVVAPEKPTTFKLSALSKVTRKHVKFEFTEPDGDIVTRTANLKAGKRKLIKAKLTVPATDEQRDVMAQASASGTTAKLPKGLQKVTVEATKGKTTLYRGQKNINTGTPKEWPKGLPKDAVNLSAFKHYVFFNTPAGKKELAKSKKACPSRELQVEAGIRPSDSDEAGNSLKVGIYGSGDERGYKYTIKPGKGQEVCAVATGSGVSFDWSQDLIKPAGGVLYDTTDGAPLVWADFKRSHNTD